MAKQPNRRVPDPNKKFVPTPRLYRTSTGLDFWFEQSRIATSDPKTCIDFLLSGGGVEEVMYVCLRFGEQNIQICQKNGKPYSPIMYRGPKYPTTWVIGAVGVPLYKRPPYGYCSLAEFKPLTFNGLEPVATDTHFASRKEQDRAMAFVTEALAKYDGYWIGAMRGLEQSAEVYVRPELQERLETGELINR